MHDAVTAKLYRCPYCKDTGYEGPVLIDGDVVASNCDQCDMGSHPNLALFRERMTPEEREMWDRA